MAIFQVPQFLDIKPKIFGPFDFKQFIFLLVAIGLSYLAFQIFSNFIAIILSTLFISLSLFLGFFKLNGLPVTKLFLKIVSHYFFKPKIYIWQKNINQNLTQKKETETDIKKIREKMSLTEKLKDLKLLVINKNNLKQKNNKTIQDFFVKKITGEKIKVKKVDYL